MPKSKINATVGFISVTGASIIGSFMASPATGGVSGAASLIGTMLAVTAFSASSGVPTLILVGLLLLCISLSISVVVAMIKDYDVEEEIKVDKIFRFKRKAKKRT